MTNDFILLGNELSKRRESKDYSIQTLSEKTKISPKFIENMESGVFDFLPHTYVRAFLRSCALELGLDPDFILQQLESARQKQKKEAEEKEALINQTTIPESKGKKKQIKQTEIKSDNSFINSNKLEDLKLFVSFYKFFIISAVIVIILLILFLSPGNDKKSQESSISNDERFTQQDSTLNQDLLKNPDSENISISQSFTTTGEFRLTITASETTWMRIVHSDSLADEAVFAPGDTKSWWSTNKFYLKIGNAGGIRLSLDNKELGTPGMSGRIANILVNRDGYSSIPEKDFPSVMYVNEQR